MTSRGRRVLAGLTVVAVAVFGAGACGSSPGHGDQITVYSGQDATLVAEWVAAFTEETGIEVVVRHGGDIGLGNRLLAEGADSPADAFLTANTPAMTLVARAGLLTEVDQATLDQVPSRYRSPANWVGVASRATAFVYDTDQVRPAGLPASLLDLAQPAWQGRWGAATASSDFQAIVTGLLALRGEDVTRAWLRGVRANAVGAPNTAATVEAVAANTPATGLIFDDAWYRAGESHGNTALHYFSGQDPGAFVSVSGAAVLAASEKHDAAQKFLAFLTSEQAAQILAANTGGAPPPATPPIDPARLDPGTALRLLAEAGLR
ncbi:extracellular solute-binding protein [Nocardia sp. NPDC059177]|uniref:extracellular solute-binding protein n=1 Tax=Nocardia sp. NPDC059177 TaxID=3346759 RepID=UPI00367F182B